MKYITTIKFDISENKDIKVIITKFLAMCFAIQWEQKYFSKWYRNPVSAPALAHQLRVWPPHRVKGRRGTISFFFHLCSTLFVPSVATELESITLECSGGVAFFFYIFPVSSERIHMPSLPTQFDSLAKLSLINSTAIAVYRCFPVLDKVQSLTEGKIKSKPLGIF